MAQQWPPFFLLYLSLALSCHYARSLLPNFNNVTDQRALLSFKSMLSDNSRDALASWNDSVDFCQWPGITCGRRHRVVSMVLSSFGLAGSISPAIANLTFLRTVDLSSNRFHGAIPPEIGRLFRLQYLNLSMNSLQGGIPETLSSCSQLQSISIRNNMLTGKIPPSLSRCSGLRNIILSNNSLSGDISPTLTNLTSLSILSLGTNQLTGRIPANIGDLYSLTYLSLANNQFTEDIPPSIGQLSKLTALGLFNNQLTGMIPPSIWNLSSLYRISLAYNNLSGSLPANAGQALPVIESIDLYYNQIEGPIPLSLANASSLQHIDLSFNRFTGTVPPNLGSLQNLEWINIDHNLLKANGWIFIDSLINCTHLRNFQIDYNNLGGILPHSIANLSTELELLALAGNGISGSIPPDIGNLVSLTNLDLGPNLLTGPIPASIGMLKNLRALDLDDNKLAGEIPSTLGNLTELIALYLDYNELSGNIPVSLGNCQNLNLLHLDSNKLIGSIPKEILTISTLSIGLGLSFNSLTGAIPSEVGSLRNLGHLDLSMNKLSGELPSNLGECQELEQLFLRGNSFHGNIPSSLSSLRGILELDLSQNNLSGRIPDFLQNFRFIFYLNLSFNDFEGEVPRRGVFANTSTFFVLGNNRVCGGSPELQLPACPSQSLNNNSHGLIVIISISIALFSLLLLFCVLVACYCRQKPRRKHLDPTPTSEQERISYVELVRATNGFSADNLIGNGSFARVYKGILQEDNHTKTVAVKVLNLQVQGASKSFMAECEALRSIRHRNLVKILTTCSSTDPTGSDFKAVVLEFMANGSLNDWLHPRENGQSERKTLSLTQRLDIAIDVASALDYLHHYCETPIIHCDLKPTNVLLDEDMTAHVGDFGLARILKKIAGKSSQCSTSSTGLKGTIGYIPPEYGMANKVSTRGDVYSYGLLLLEMFTAKSPTDDIFTAGLSLRKFVGNAFPDRVADVMDARLLSLEDGEETDDVQRMKDARTIECIASVLLIGISCSNELPTERFEIGEVIRELHKIKTVFQPNETRL